MVTSLTLDTEPFNRVDALLAKCMRLGTTTKVTNVAVTKEKLECIAIMVAKAAKVILIDRQEFILIMPTTHFITMAIQLNLRTLTRSLIKALEDRQLKGIGSIRKGEDIVTVNVVGVVVLPLIMPPEWLVEIVMVKAHQQTTDCG